MFRLLFTIALLLAAAAKEFKIDEVGRPFLDAQLPAAKWYDHMAAKTDHQNKLHEQTAGARDYMTKPEWGDVINRGNGYYTKKGFFEDKHVYCPGGGLPCH